LKDFNINPEIEKYGKIIAVSNNGQGVVFMNKNAINSDGELSKFAEFTIARITD
jgi:hypothetical protein